MGTLDNIKDSLELDNDYAIEIDLPYSQKVTNLVDGKSLVPGSDKKQKLQKFTIIRMMNDDV